MLTSGLKIEPLFNFLPHFLDVPDPPEHVKCMSVGEDTATIVWDAPKFDGGAPLKGGDFHLFSHLLNAYADILLLTCLCVYSVRLSHGEEEERLLQMD